MTGQLEPAECVYGRHPVREALRGRRTVRQLYATTRAATDLTLPMPRVRIVEHEELTALSGSEDHQGVVAHVTAFAYESEEVLVERVRSSAGEGLVVCLDQVTDPRNLGAIARVCDAAGATALVVPRHRSATVTAVACKTSAGALEHIAVCQCRNMADFLAKLTAAGAWIYGFSEHGKTSYTAVDFTGSPVALVLGAEGEGLRPRVQDACDQLVQVPMSGAVASLNVATVAAIGAFEVVRQRAW